MREATGNAFLTAMITSVITIIMMFFVGSLSYSKAYKVKNYIVNKIEENKGWTEDNENELIDDIDGYLKSSGYYVKPKNFNCKETKKSNAITCNLVNEKSQFQYCVYKCGSGTPDDVNKNVYYKVVTYSKFEFPIVRNLVTFKVSGETQTFSDFN